MRLILKITIIYLLISLVVFLLGGLITFEVINREVDFEQKGFLRERLTSVSHMIEHRHLDHPIVRDKIAVYPLTEHHEDTEIVYSDTLVMHATLQRMEPHVKLDVIKNINDRSYKISIYDLIIEQDDIADGVQESLIKMYLLLTVVVLVLSSLTSFWLLKPFNRTLEKIKNFSLRRDKKVSFEHSRTKEFNKLNQFLEDMMTKMQRDFQNMKEFTENAAHEMQTPLSIASGKLEILLDAENLNEEQLAMITSAQQSLKRLSKLNKSLSLLTKIENKEFENVQEIDLSEELKRQIYDFDELIKLKSIVLSTVIEEHVHVKMDSVLCGVLITNLLQNAIRHNKEHGEIDITLDHTRLEISNTGDSLSTDPQLLFERFRKANQSHESLGLGLAIVKKIIDTSGFKIDYRYKDNKHIIEVQFGIK